VLAAISSRLQGQRFVPHQGGVALRDTAENIVGAAGVSGATAEEDKAIACAGAESYSR